MQIIITTKSHYWDGIKLRELKPGEYFLPVTFTKKSEAMKEIRTKKLLQLFKDNEDDAKVAIVLFEKEIRKILTTKTIQNIQEYVDLCILAKDVYYY